MGETLTAPFRTATLLHPCPAHTAVATRERTRNNTIFIRIPMMIFLKEFSCLEQRFPFILAQEIFRDNGPQNHFSP
jgi:hypothetical protein